MIDLTEGELRDRFGEGATPAPALFSSPGPVLLWPLELDDGQLVLLLRDLTGGFTFVMANPKISTAPSRDWASGPTA